MNTPLRYFLPAVFLSFVVASCHQSGEASVTDESEGNENQTVLTREQFATGEMAIASLDQVSFENVVRMNGLITAKPESKARVSIMMPGFVKRISVSEGEYVQKGQPLLVLENTDYIQLQQDYLEAFHSLNYLQTEYERQKALAGDNITSQKDFLGAQSEYEKMRAACEGLGEMLKLLNLDPERVNAGNIASEVSIIAPFSGYVTKQEATLGMYIEPQDVPVEMVDQKDLQLRLTAFEKDVPLIEPGQVIRYRSADAMDHWHVGKVGMVGRSVDSESRTISVYGSIGEEDKDDLMDGMYVEAEVVTRDRQAYGLPNEALLREDDKYFVFVKTAEDGDDLIFHKLYVNTGQMTEDSTEILTDDEIHDILIRGAFNLNIE